MRQVGILAAAFLAACGPALPDQEDRAHPMGVPRGMADGKIADPFPGPQDTSPQSLVGHWRVAGIDDAPFDAPYGIAVRFSEDRIEFDNCQQIAWTYTHEAGKVTTRRTPAITIDIAPKPVPCAAALPAPVAAMVDAIDAAEKAQLTPENGVRLSGGGHSVTLFRQ